MGSVLIGEVSIIKRFHCIPSFPSKLMDEISTPDWGPYKSLCGHMTVM